MIEWEAGFSPKQVAGGVRMDNMSIDKEKLLGLLGLARRAGKLAMGFHAVERLVKRGENPFVIVATDIGPSQRNKVMAWEPVRGLMDDVFTGDEIAQSFGREKLVVVAVSDHGFVKGLKKSLQSG